MSKIFEIFGFPLHSVHPEALASRANARCPFMESNCDGGGNRYLSALDLSRHPDLAKKFSRKGVVQAGVCSLMVRNEPWIVCPRRLLALGGPNRSVLQKRVREDLARYGGLEKGEVYRAWSEVKIKAAVLDSDAREKSFNYTFDYVLAEKKRKKLSEISKLVQKSEKNCEKIASQNGFTLARRGGKLWVDDFPHDPVIIVEIMTSSTSGGNKSKRTQIAMAFEDALLKGESHEGPGINYRQVWARMVSQLIVKSQVGLAWGGKTVWVLQDVLADYISSTTGLNLSKYVSEIADEVNILSFGYGENPRPDSDSGIVQLEDSQFFSGPVSTASPNDRGRGFVDIITIGGAPPKESLWRALFLKSSCGRMET